MAVFGKKSEGTVEETSREYVRIPHGTRFGRTDDGKLTISFAGDISFGEDLPELGELTCGRNLSLDPGVTIRADVVHVKESLEIEEGASLLTRELEAEKLVLRKGKVEARTIQTGTVEAESTKLVADRLTAREGAFFDRGTLEIGTVMAQTLTVTKGTNANILIAEVAKLDGFIPKGGYENFGELLAKLYLYHPEILNDRFTAEARRLVGAKPGDTRPAAPLAATPAVAPPPMAPPASEGKPTPDMALLGRRIRAFYDNHEPPKDMIDLITHLEHGRLEEVRRDLTPVYQRMAGQGKMPEPLMELFREVQKVARDGGRVATSPPSGAAGSAS